MSARRWAAAAAARDGRGGGRWAGQPVGRRGRHGASGEPLGPGEPCRTAGDAGRGSARRRRPAVRPGRRPGVGGAGAPDSGGRSGGAGLSGGRGVRRPLRDGAGQGVRRPPAGPGGGPGDQRAGQDRRGGAQRGRRSVGARPGAGYRTRSAPDGSRHRHRPGRHHGQPGQPVRPPPGPCREGAAPAGWGAARGGFRSGGRGHGGQPAHRPGRPVDARRLWRKRPRRGCGHRRRRPPAPAGEAAGLGWSGRPQPGQRAGQFHRGDRRSSGAAGDGRAGPGTAYAPVAASG